MLFAAVRENDIYGVLDLLNYAYDEVNSQLNNGMTPLMLAVKRSDNDAQMVRALLTSPYLDVNIQDNQGFTALMMAVEDSKMQAVEALLADSRVNVNILNDDGLAALMLVKSVDIADALLADARVDVNITNRDGWTPLMVALRAKNLPVVISFLKNRCVNVNASALELALDMDNNEVIRLILTRFRGLHEIQNRQITGRFASPLMIEAQRILQRK